MSYTIISRPLATSQIYLLVTRMALYFVRLEVQKLNDLSSRIDEAHCKSLVMSIKSSLHSGNLCALQSSADVTDVTDRRTAARMSISKSVAEMREYVGSMTAADTQDMQGVQQALDQVP